MLPPAEGGGGTRKPCIGFGGATFTCICGRGMDGALGPPGPPGLPGFGPLPSECSPARPDITSVYSLGPCTGAAGGGDAGANCGVRCSGSSETGALGGATV